MAKRKLQDLTKKQLMERARRKGIADYQSMKKDDLIAALAKVAVPRPARSSKSVKKKAVLRSRPQLAAARNTNGSSSAEEQVERSKFDVGVPTKDLSAKVPRDLPAGYGKDRIVCMVRDPYWLHCYWELTRQAIQRAEAALGQEWHGARPILRLLDVTSNDITSGTETIVRDIDIHGGVNNWYIDVQDPPKSFRVDIGYVTAGGRFYSLARSNVVTTPRAGNKDDIDQNWTDIATDFERIYAQSGGYNGDGNGSVELQEVFEERLRRPMGSSLISRFGPGVDGLLAGKKPFHFEIDAELIVFGKTDPDAKVTLQNEPIKLRPDGTFTVRYSLPNARQVIPAVAASANGLEQRTVVLAVERNTKAMEPLVRDQGNSSSPE